LIITTGIGIEALLTGNSSSKIELIATDVGYHRLRAARPYDVSLVLKLWLTAFVGSPVEDAVGTWSGEHVAHHRYTDTVNNIYSVRKRLLYAHNGRLVLKQNPNNLGRADVFDLDKDPVVVWQHNHYMLALRKRQLPPPSCCNYMGVFTVCTSFKRTARGQIWHILLQEQLLDTA
jgi:fatty-acid desaturase